MGTTQRIIPGVTGEPNWGNLNIAVTSIANTVEREQQVGQEAEKAVERENVRHTDANKKAIDLIYKQQRMLVDRRKQHFSSALRNLIRTGGGRIAVVKGQSHSLGRAGLSNAKRLSGFFISIQQNGFQNTLNEIGFGSLKGKKLQEVIDFLLVYFADENTGMDEIAANMASCQIIEMLSVDIKSVVEFEKKLNSLTEDNMLTELISNFYGLYLYEHLSQRFQEKITQIKGEAVSKETFLLIKEDILEQIKSLNKQKALSEINWKGKAGKELEEKIFNSIIQIFE